MDHIFVEGSFGFCKACGKRHEVPQTKMKAVGQSSNGKKAEWMSYQGDFITPEGIQKTREFVAFVGPLMGDPNETANFSMKCIAHYNSAVRFLKVNDDQ